MKLSYRKLSILIVDSISTGIDTLKDYLKPYQFYRVWTASDSGEALNILKDKELHLAILSHKLKPMSGFQLLSAIRENPRTKDLAVLVSLDRRQKDLEAKAAELGATGFLNIPFESKAINSTVEQVLEVFVDPAQEMFLQNITAARRALRRSKWKEAEDGFRGALSVREDQEARLGLGRALRMQERYKEAEDCYITRLKLDPDDIKAYLGLCATFQASGRAGDGIKVLAAAIKAANRLKSSGEVTANLYMYMGEIELQLMHLKGALSCFRQAQATDPKNTGMQTRIGDALCEAGHFTESEEFYHRALEEDPELAHVYNRLGIAYRKQEKFDLALNLYLKALKFLPDDEHLMYNTARCHWEMGSHQEGIDILSRALAINPEFSEAIQLRDVIQKELEL